MERYIECCTAILWINGRGSRLELVCGRGQNVMSRRI
jgi:hypothetical protein